MGTKVDTIFMMDCGSSIAADFDRIQAVIRNIGNMILNKSNDNRIGLIKFQTTHDQMPTNVHGFTHDVQIFQQWVNGAETGGVGPDQEKAIGEAMKMALDFPWCELNIDDISYEKLVILLTDGAPSGLLNQTNSTDPWVLSKEFSDKGIILIVVGVGKGIVECDDFYCALAQSTGGEYIPMVNFERIFARVLDATFNDGDTIHQALIDVPMDEIEQDSDFIYGDMICRVLDMVTKCKTMADIRRKFFNFRPNRV